MEHLDAAPAGLEGSVLTDVLLPVVLGLIMLGMGLGLRVQHFRLLFLQPWGVLAGLVGQLLLLPLCASLVVVAFVVWGDLEYELALGLLLLAAVPGGATSNMLTWLARGDTALSVTLTAVTSIGSFLLTPFVLFVTTNALYGDAQAITMPFGDVLALTLGVVAGPVVLGMVVGHFFPRLGEIVDRPLRIGSIVFLALLIAGIVYTNRVGFWGFLAATVPAALALNVLALATGFATALLFRLPDAQRRAITIEVGFQNGTFAILLAFTQLESTRAALMPGFYSLVMYVTGFTLVGLWTRKAGAGTLGPAQDAVPGRHT